MSAMLPENYRWLNSEPAPRMLLEALKLYGTIETPGKQNNATIMGWAEETGLGKIYSADAIPWCGLFMAVVARRGGKPIATSPLWALSWSKWGDVAGQPRLGDVMTFVRQGGGHVGLYVGEDTAAYHILGGNQSDAVTITRINKSRFYAARRLYKIGMPPNCRPVILAPTGAISTNEQ